MTSAPAIESAAPTVGVVIPTFGREEILIETIARVLALDPASLAVVDQTAAHQPETERALADWEQAGRIRLIRLAEPSIPRAMNVGLLETSADITLFLDDDVVPSPGLLAAHARAYEDAPEAWAVVGQVLQPGEEPDLDGRQLPPGFNSCRRAWINRAIACNLSVKRDRFLEVGGFDENFVLAAYCFETEFAERVNARGGRVLFEPGAGIRHLHAARGGTRAHGHHLTTLTPAHAVGAYYHLLLRHGPVGAVPPALHRLVRSVYTCHHLRHPWGIPVTLVAELRGWMMACSLSRSGPKLLDALTASLAK